MMGRDVKSNIQPNPIALKIEKIKINKKKKTMNDEKNVG